MKLPAWIAAPLELAALLVLRERGAGVDGRRDGTWTRHFPGGALFTECEWRAGLRHGRERRWYLDGTPRWHGEWRDGQKSGEWIHMTREERVDPELTGVYENGEKIGPVRGFNDWKH
jgi:antitoxin component YwqK of YwqJK toxin-antitoxin module